MFTLEYFNPINCEKQCFKKNCTNTYKLKKIVVTTRCSELKNKNKEEKRIVMYICKKCFQDVYPQKCYLCSLYMYDCKEIIMLCDVTFFFLCTSCATYFFQNLNLNEKLSIEIQNYLKSNNEDSKEILYHNRRHQHFAEIKTTFINYINDDKVKINSKKKELKSNLIAANLQLLTKWLPYVTNQKLLEQIEKKRRYNISDDCNLFISESFLN